MMLLQLLVEECFLVILFPLEPSLAEIPEHHLQVNEFLVNQLLLILLYRLCSNVPVLPRTLSGLLLLFSLNLHGLLIAGHLQSLLGSINFAWERNRAKISEDRCLKIDLAHFVIEALFLASLDEFKHLDSIIMSTNALHPPISDVPLLLPDSFFGILSLMAVVCHVLLDLLSPI